MVVVLLPLLLRLQPSATPAGTAHPMKEPTCNSAHTGKTITDAGKSHIIEGICIDATDANAHPHLEQSFNVTSNVRQP